MPKDKFTRIRTAARHLAAEYFERFPKDRYQTEIESWRHLQSDNIEFTLKRLREATPTRVTPSGGNRLRFRRARFVLKSRCWELLMRRSWTASIVPNGHDQIFYLVVNNYGKIGTAFAETDVAEADLETTIIDLMSGRYNNPVRVVAFNNAEHWSEDASEDVALEIQRRFDLAGDALPSSIAAFVDRHLGPDR